LLCEDVAVKGLPLQRAENRHLQRAKEEISLLTGSHGWEVLPRLHSATFSLGLDKNGMDALA